MERITKNCLLALWLLLSTDSQSLGFELDQIINKYALNIPSQESEVSIKRKITVKLEDIESLINKNNLELENYRLRIEQNKYLLRSAISLWYPTLNLTSNGLPQYLDGYTYNKPDSSTNTLSSKWTTSASAKVKWDIINPKRKPEINIAKSNFEKAKLAYTIKFRDLKLIALKEYFKLQQSFEDVRIAKKSVEYSKLMLNESKIRLKSGIGTKLDVLEAKTQLARDLQFLSQKKGAHKYNERSFAEALSFPSQMTATVNSPPQVIGLWPSSLEKSIIASYSFQKEIESLLLDISINSNNADAAIASTKPTVSIFNNLSTSFSKGQSNVLTSPDMENRSSAINNTVGISATWQLIDGGSARALYEYNKSKAKEAKITIQSSLAKIRKDVEKSFFELETARENISTTNTELISARESLRLTKLKFESGINTQREIVNHQRDLTEAEVNNVQAITNYNIHLSDLRRQTGLDKIKYCLDKNELSQIDSTSNIFNVCKDKVKSKR
tara:strand:+ start:22553 stop:24052 length:1500 start_codon:yes stop_codon:yes gene_type:complete